MSGANWLVVVASFLGAGIGAALSYVAARKATGQLERQGRREEWGRRFTAALGYFAEQDTRARELGRELLVLLARSQLASPEEQALADDILTAEARHGSSGRDVASLVAGRSLDQITFVEGDEDPRTDGSERDDSRSDRPPGRPEGAAPARTVIIPVGRDQVSAARALIQLRGGPDNVDPMVARIADSDAAHRR